LTYLLQSPQRHARAGPLRPRAPHLPEFKPGHTVAFTDKHLRECVGTIVGINPKNLLPAPCCATASDGAWRRHYCGKSSI
jgi:hypothetical protein